MHRAQGRMRAAAVLIIAVVLSATGCATAVTVDAPEPAASAFASPVGPLAAGGLQDPQQPSAGTPIDAIPVRLRIPSIGVDSSLEDLAIEGDGRLAAPQDYDLAGWYSDGVVPGEVGPAIIAGHVDSPTAPAVFAKLGDLATGAEIVVAMSDGTELDFHVSGSAQSSKAEFPTTDVYSNVPAPELRLITCAGDFDSEIGHYTDNLIVFASLG